MHADQVLRRAAQHATPCNCPICATVRGLHAIRDATREIDSATNFWIEYAGEEEGDMYFLLDEMRAAVELSPRRARRRIVSALATVDARTQMDWQRRKVEKP